jgi:hypothetical protein
MINVDEDSQDYVYLSKNKKYKKLPAYTYNRGNVFIGNLPTNNINAVSRLLGHEALHNALNNSINLKTSIKLDNITVPYIHDDNNKPEYPDTIGIISPLYKKYMEADTQEETDKYGKQIDEKYTDIIKYFLHNVFIVKELNNDLKQTSYISANINR